MPPAIETEWGDIVSRFSDGEERIYTLIENTEITRLGSSHQEGLPKRQIAIKSKQRGASVVIARGETISEEDVMHPIQVDEGTIPTADGKVIHIRYSEGS